MQKHLRIILKSPKQIFGLFLITLVCACSQNNEDAATTLVKKSIEAHGGQKKYDALEAISFIKTTRLYLDDGRLESEVIQKQRFELSPRFLVNITWTIGVHKHAIFFDGDKAIKTVDSKVIKDPLEVTKAINTAKAASYVFFQPFELLNDNTMLSLGDTVTINDTLSAQAVTVSYKNDTQNSDKWTYYFDDNDMLVANSVILKDHNSLIENLEYQSASGLVFNKYRKSYRVDKQLNRKYLRAEYSYLDLRAKFKE